MAALAPDLERTRPVRRPEQEVVGGRGEREGGTARPAEQRRVERARPVRRPEQEGGERPVRRSRRGERPVRQSRRGRSERDEKNVREMSEREGEKN